VAQAWQTSAGLDELPSLKDLDYLGSFEHAITRYRIRVRVLRVLASVEGKADPRGSASDHGLRFVDLRDLVSLKSPSQMERKANPDFGLTALAQKAIDLLPDNFG
jgi:hypothetical protein